MADNATHDDYDEDRYLQEYVESIVCNQEDTSYPVRSIDSFGTWITSELYTPAYLTAKTAARYILSDGELITLTCSNRNANLRTMLWAHYDNVSTSLAHIFDELEGWTASRDKARLVIRAYDKSLETGKKPEELPDVEERADFLPQHGTMNQWCNLAEMILLKKLGPKYSRLMSDILDEHSDTVTD